MREGIKVRSGELEQLREALDDVGRPKPRLEEKARQVIGDVPDLDSSAWALEPLTRKECLAVAGRQQA